MNHTEILRKLGARIRELRELRHMTQLSLAIESHVNETYISRLEHGRQNTTIETLKDICDALQVDIKQLFE